MTTFIKTFTLPRFGDIRTAGTATPPYHLCMSEFDQ